ncbi:MAG: DNA mismatch repair endonuclease MutL [Bacteroidetes Order II. Incertae sedis bacterium]|nr:DNA mismatch repair endonuclease MutL [Bacteroidetes Order II. bacterium]
MPAHLANKIAAGEVVQRPANAVKELMENSLDAGASHITLRIKKAGSELIQVQDDGCGMSSEDAVSCFLRHATSKIKSIEDLDRIRTMGFRGEALASIAAVAQVELRTKRIQDEAGTLVRIEGSTFSPTMPVATPNGTLFSIRNLFYNVPARRNFLKSPATEFKRITEVFQFLALSQPDIAFSLHHDDREIYELPARETPSGLQERIADLFSVSVQTLIPLYEEIAHVRVKGYISKPDFTRKTRGEQFLFVNRRFIKNHRLEQAIQLGYGDLLPRGAYPFFALFIELDPAHVDVNVHPTKTEVQFDDESGLFGLLRGAVKRALGELDISPNVTYEAGKWTEKATTTLPNARSFTPPKLSDKPALQPNNHSEWAAPRHTSQYVPPKRPDDLFRGDFRKANDALYQGISSAAQPSETISPPPTTVAPTSEFSDRVWQLHDKYILSQTDHGMAILDQHAAHERILYERFLKQMTAGQAPSQHLLFPQTISFQPGDFALILELQPDLLNLGFGFETLSGRSVMLTGVPADIPPGREEAMLEEVLEQYKSYRDELDLKGRDNLAKSLACRAAIKTGKKLTDTEIRSLYTQLMTCEMPYACPHGRPTLIRISLEELDKRFGRIGHLETQGTIKRR